MGKNIDAGHNEKVPLDEQTPPEGKAWWIPVFPVNHPKREKFALFLTAPRSTAAQV
jgi:hypothetical protein